MVTYCLKKKNPENFNFTDDALNRSLLDARQHKYYFSVLTEKNLKGQSDIEQHNIFKEIPCDSQILEEGKTSYVLCELSWFSVT